jgi:hypothetical protein
MSQVIISFSDEAKEIFSFLAEKSLSSKQERMLFDSVRNKIEVIKKNPYYGNNIPKKLIPEYYKEKYHVKNLFHVKLPIFWRMLYSLGDNKNDIEIIAFIVEILGHKKYNKRFGYKKH